MEVTYDLTAEDVWHYVLYHRRHKSGLRPAFKNAFRGVMVLVFIGYLVMCVDSLVRHQSVNWNMLIGLAAALWLASRFLGPSKAKVMKGVALTPGLICRHTFTIEPEWLSDKTEVNESKTRWDIIYQIDEDAQYVYVFPSKMNAHIIPKRAFRHPAEAQAFVDAAKDFWMSAKTGIEATPQEEQPGVWPPPPRRSV